MHAIRTVTIVGIMAVLVGSHAMARGEPLSTPDKPAVASRGERWVHVAVGKVVSVAIGNGAAAQMSIASGDVSDPAEQHDTTREDDITLVAVGPGAKACLHLPGLTTPMLCTEPNRHNTHLDR